MPVKKMEGSTSLWGLRNRNCAQLIRAYYDDGNDNGNDDDMENIPSSFS
jgi:hypothetical protein